MKQVGLEWVGREGLIQMKKMICCERRRNVRGKSGNGNGGIRDTTMASMKLPSHKLAATASPTTLPMSTLPSQIPSSLTTDPFLHLN
ncbi:hypothetical protein A2U01_0043442, partial [Trifolium medium]|nr:hypothetical protein [Trifolium medium]